GVVGFWGVGVGWGLGWGFGVVVGFLVFFGFVVCFGLCGGCWVFVGGVGCGGVWLLACLFGFWGVVFGVLCLLAVVVVGCGC
ncbi:hypothetical protein DVA80_21125, partial [Acinetobacter baumannii]|uniref:hypothetical protein n=1 Tax=Acinetobacter baumannii TaxID=470 RepID=UPI000DF49CD2